MKYTYTVTIRSDENVRDEDQWPELEVQCAHAAEAAQIINNHFGFSVASRDSVYNYFNRRHLCNKKLFGAGKEGLPEGPIRLERTRLKRSSVKKARATTEAQCSPVSSCS